MCNLLVIVACVYRLLCRERDLDATEERMSFTSVDLDTVLSESTVDKYGTTMVEQRSMVSETSRSRTTRSDTIEETEEESGVGSRLA